MCETLSPTRPRDMYRALPPVYVLSDGHPSGHPHKPLLLRILETGLGKALRGSPRPPGGRAPTCHWAETAGKGHLHPSPPPPGQQWGAPGGPLWEWDAGLGVPAPHLACEQQSQACRARRGATWASCSHTFPAPAAEALSGLEAPVTLATAERPPPPRSPPPANLNCRQKQRLLPERRSKEQGAVCNPEGPLLPPGTSQVALQASISPPLYTHHHHHLSPPHRSIEVQGPGKGRSDGGYCRKEGLARRLRADGRTDRGRREGGAAGECLRSVYRDSCAGQGGLGRVGAWVPLPGPGLSVTHGRKRIRCKRSRSCRPSARGQRRRCLWSCRPPCGSRSPPACRRPAPGR